MSKRLLTFLEFFIVIILLIQNCINHRITTKKYPDIDMNRPMIAITFDDGPDSTYTPRILKALKENNARATFFVNGSKVKDNEEILRRMTEFGYEIGNHTYEHKNLRTLSQIEITSQIVRTQEIIEGATGTTPTLFRPPYGKFNMKTLRNANNPVILWSLCTYDYSINDTDTLVKRVLLGVYDGDIILMHDTYKSTVEAIEILIPELKKRGYQFVTVSELYQYRNIEMKPGRIYVRPSY